MAFRHCRRSEILPDLPKVGMGERSAHGQEQVEDRDEFCRDAQLSSHPLKADQWENLVGLRPLHALNSPGEDLVTERKHRRL